MSPTEFNPDAFLAAKSADDEQQRLKQEQEAQAERERAAKELYDKQKQVLLDALSNPEHDNVASLQEGYQTVATALEDLQAVDPTFSIEMLEGYYNRGGEAAKQLEPVIKALDKLVEYTSQDRSEGALSRTVAFEAFAADADKKNGSVEKQIAALRALIQDNSDVAMYVEKLRGEAITTKQGVVDEFVRTYATYAGGQNGYGYSPDQKILVEALAISRLDRQKSVSPYSRIQPDLQSELLPEQDTAEWSELAIGLSRFREDLRKYSEERGGEWKDSVIRDVGWKFDDSTGLGGEMVAISNGVTRFASPMLIEAMKRMGEAQQEIEKATGIRKQLTEIISAPYVENARHQKTISLSDSQLAALEGVFTKINALAQDTVTREMESRESMVATVLEHIEADEQRLQRIKESATATEERSRQIAGITTDMRQLNAKLDGLRQEKTKAEKGWFSKGKVSGLSKEIQDLENKITVLTNRRSQLEGENADAARDSYDERGIAFITDRLKKNRESLEGYKQGRSPGYELAK